jgi:hypothetical protein
MAQKINEDGQKISNRTKRKRRKLHRSNHDMNVTRDKKKGTHELGPTEPIVIK